MIHIKLSTAVHIPRRYNRHFLLFPDFLIVSQYDLVFENFIIVADSLFSLIRKLFYRLFLILLIFPDEIIVPRIQNVYFYFISSDCTFSPIFRGGAENPLPEWVWAYPLCARGFIYHLTSQFSTFPLATTPSVSHTATSVRPLFSFCQFSNICSHYHSYPQHGYF